jgi:hypothetical protein
MDSQSDETEAREGLFIVHGLMKSERTLHDANIELGGCLLRSQKRSSFGITVMDIPVRYRPLVRDCCYDGSEDPSLL